jgi:hypothetical protein
MQSHGNNKTKGAATAPKTRQPDIMKTQPEIKGSYVTPDGKAQIDFGITYRNGYPEFTASGFFNGSSGQCIEGIKNAYDLHHSDDLREILAWWQNRHLKALSPQEVEAVSRLATQHPFRSFYDTQAETFLANNGIRLRITLSDSKTAPWSPAGHHYRVTLSGKKPCDCVEHGEESKLKHLVVCPRQNRRITFDFWDSVNAAEKGTAPTAYDILACLSGDAYCPETFADFCAEYGENPDSLKAVQTWKRCHSFAKRLRAFFTPAELAQLSEIR